MIDRIIFTTILFFLFSCLLPNNKLKPVLKNKHSNLLEATQLENIKIEVGIESIIKDEDNYIIAVYAVNPFDEIAGIQFEILNENLFYIDSVYGGKTSNQDFSMHFNKKGTILGFSMVGNTIERTKIVSHTDRKSKNILFYVKAKANKLTDYLKISDESILMDVVIASKEGKTLSSEFIPFSLSDIKE